MVYKKLLLIVIIIIMVAMCFQYYLMPLRLSIEYIILMFNKLIKGKPSTSLIKRLLYMCTQIRNVKLNGVESLQIGSK